MSCYHPLVGIFDGEYLDSGKKKFKIEGNLDPFEVQQVHPGSVVIPCGKCLGCKLDRSRAWADRMMLELETAGCAVFVTLTYDNDHITWCHADQEGVPDYGTLVKDDVQRFMKRLRKYFSDRKIRFYLGGEYGDRTNRPHYHAILFGLRLSDFPDKSYFGVNELRQPYYISDQLSRLWSNGFVLLCDVSWRTCAYVARYVSKKTGDVSILREILNQEPEFGLMSRRPGIGSEYYDLHPDCLDYQKITISESDGARDISIPKYFLKKLELTDPDRYAKIMSDRKTFASDRMLLELSRTDLSYLEYLEVKENNKMNSVKSLHRDLV